MKRRIAPAIEFENRFRFEEDCVAYLRQMRWPKGFICPKCTHAECYELTLRLYQCSSCGKQTSVTAGTIFHKTRIPLTVWFRVIFAMAQDKGGTSSTRVASYYGLSQKTAWLMLHKLRAAMAERNELTKLEGVIELDEAFINKEARKYQPESGTETQILVMAEEENDHAGKIYVQVLNAATCANIRDAVEFATVAEQKHSFKADGWHAHHVLKRMGHDSDVKPAPKKLGIQNYHGCTPSCRYFGDTLSAHITALVQSCSSSTSTSSHFEPTEDSDKHEFGKASSALVLLQNLPL